MMNNYTRFRSTDPINAPALNQRFDELSNAVDDVVRDAPLVGYVPGNGAHWNPDPTTVQLALDDLAARLFVQSNHLFVSGLELEGFTSSNTVTVWPGVCLSDDGETLIEVGSSGLSIAVNSTGINGKDTGSAANNTWYFVWLCRGTSGVGAVYSSSPVPGGVSFPAGYDQHWRRIGSFRTNGSAAVRSFAMPLGQGASRRVYYTEVANAAPYQILSGVDIGTSGAQTTVDCSGIVSPTARWVIALIECSNPSAAVDVFWNPNNARNNFIMRLLATTFSTAVRMDLEVPWNGAVGRIYSSGTSNENLSFYVVGYIEDSLAYLGYTP